MSSIREQASRHRSQYLVIVGLSIGVVGLATILQSFDPLIFPRFIGQTHPLIAVSLVSTLGIVLLSLLLRRGWFAIFEREHIRWLWRSAALGALFALATVVLDLQVVFPADLNVALPAALLFYPAIGFVVEVVFHLLPLSVLLLALTAIPRIISPQRATVPPGLGITWCGISYGDRCGCRSCSDDREIDEWERGGHTQALMGRPLCGGRSRVRARRTFGATIRSCLSSWARKTIAMPARPSSRSCG
jgi:hypothetical protein